MKIKLFVFIFLLIFLTSCNIDKEVWTINFETSYTNGICYYINNETVFTSSGELAFHNVSNIPVHLFIYNDTEGGKLEYEADLDLGGILSYPNIDKNSKYTIGVRVLDGKLKQDIKVLVYSNFDLIHF